MAIINCIQCHKLYDNALGWRVCHDCLEIERERYDGVYQTLSTFYRHLDVVKLARRAGLSRELLKDTLEYWMGYSEVSHNQRNKKGSCHICQSRLSSRDFLEPLCIRCLDVLEKELVVMEAELHGEEASGEDEFSTDDLFPPAGQQTGCTLCGNGSAGMICMSCHQQSLEKVRNEVMAAFTHPSSVSSVSMNSSPDVTQTLETLVSQDVAENEPMSGQLSSDLEALQASVPADDRLDKSSIETDTLDPLLRLIESDEQSIDWQESLEDKLTGTEDRGASRPSRRYGFKRGRLK